MEVLTIDRRPRRQRLLEARLGSSVRDWVLERYNAGETVEEIAQQLTTIGGVPITERTVYRWITDWAAQG